MKKASASGRHCHWQVIAVNNILQRLTLQLCVTLRWRHSGSSSTPLAEGLWTDWLQTRRPHIQMPACSAWVGTAVPHRRTLPTSWSRGSTATTLSLAFITDCPGVRRTQLSTVGDQAFSVAAARVWNNLPQHVTYAPSLHVFAYRLKTDFFCFLSRTVLNVQCLWSDFVIIRHSNQLSLHDVTCSRAPDRDLEVIFL